MPIKGRSVKVIPQTINPKTRMSDSLVSKRKVAGYARVSTDSDEQYTSYEAQVDYYTRFIKSKPNWVFVDVYTDEGISGTNTKHRAGFNKMIKDALAGKIDLIVTKSISRFARNTVDSLTYIRKLKEHNVEVYFEKENIYTFDSKGEVLITIMSSLAQEESRSISENVKWGKRKRFADGKFSLGYSCFLGYKKGPNIDSPLEIVEEEAKIVRKIYTMYIEGDTSSTISKRLNEENIPTPSGKGIWRNSTIESILSNEKYKGSALLQKKFTIDFLQHKMVQNNGEIPKYYIENSHDAIIPPEDWELVQLEMARRKTLGRRYSGKSVFGSRFICEDCGSFFGPKTWGSTSKYRQRVWQCNNKFSDKDHHCKTPHLKEENIKERFINVFNEYVLYKDNVIDDCRRMLDTINDTKDIEEKIESVNRESKAIKELMEKLINKNSSNEISQEEFNKKYKEYEKTFIDMQNKKTKLEKQSQQRKEKTIYIELFMLKLNETDDILTEFDSKLWTMVIDSVLVKRDGSLIFQFKNGMKIEG